MKGKLPDPFPVCLWAREVSIRAEYRANGGQLEDVHGLPELRKGTAQHDLAVGVFKQAVASNVKKSEALTPMVERLRINLDSLMTALVGPKEERETWSTPLL